MARQAIQVRDAILKGIRKAHRDYYRMSGGYWMSDGPESWVQIYVARALWKIFGDGTVACEAGSTATVEDAGRRRKRLSSLVKGKRYDIVLYFKKGTPRAVIEIKRQKSKESVLRDVKKVVAALKAANLRFGAVAYLRSRPGGKQKTASEKLSDYVNDIELRADKVTGRKYTTKNSRAYISGDTDDAWIADCILIERR